MARVASKKFEVIPNPELRRVAKAFVPVFGNDQDLQMVHRVLALETLLATVDNKVLREGDPKKMTSKMRDILREEQYLIQGITSRNMDF